MKVKLLKKIRKRYEIIYFHEYFYRRDARHNPGYYLVDHFDYLNHLRYFSSYENAYDYLRRCIYNKYYRSKRKNIYTAKHTKLWFNVNKTPLK